MEGIYARRRASVIQIVQERFEGNRSAFDRAVGFADRSRTSGYLSGEKNIGERLARRIEKTLGLPDRWLDMEERRRKRRVPLHPLRTAGGSSPKVHSLQKLLSAGYSQKEIARQLGVHESTVSKALKRERERPEHAAA